MALASQRVASLTLSVQLVRIRSWRRSTVSVGGGGKGRNLKYFFHWMGSQTVTSVMPTSKNSFCKYNIWKKKKILRSEEFAPWRPANSLTSYTRCIMKMVPTSRSLWKGICRSSYFRCTTVAEGQEVVISLHKTIKSRSRSNLQPNIFKGAEAIYSSTEANTSCWGLFPSLGFITPIHYQASEHIY